MCGQRSAVGADGSWGQCCAGFHAFLPHISHGASATLHPDCRSYRKVHTLLGLNTYPKQLMCEANIYIFLSSQDKQSSLNSFECESYMVTKSTNNEI